MKGGQGERAGLRLDTGRHVDVGLYVLVAVALGAALAFYLAIAGPGIDARLSYNTGCTVFSTRAFNKLLEGSSTPVLVMFSSDSCPVCKMIEPDWLDACSSSDSYTFKLLLLKLNDDTINIFIEYNIEETPTFILFNGAEPVARLTGAPEGGVEDILEWATIQATTLQPGTPEPGTGMGMLILAAPTLFAAGLAAAASPCVLPLLAAYSTLVAATGTGAGYGRLARFTVTLTSAAAGGVVISLLFLAFGRILAGAGTILALTAGIVLAAAGLLELLGVPSYTGVKTLRGRGVIAMSFLYGVLSLQCSLPLVAGALFSIASSGLLEEGLVKAGAFILGLSLPPALAAAGLASRLLETLSRGPARTLVSILLVAGGLLMVMVSIGFVG